MERRLAAILAIDMVGYSRLMGADESGTIARHKRHREAFIDPQIARYAGRIVKTTGDGLLADFPSVVDAVDCALAFQSALADEEHDTPEEKRVVYRAGINLGDIVFDGEDILGDGVNVAARLEAIAPPAGLCVSDVVRQNLRGAVGESFEDMGEQSLKNIDRKVRVWRWPAADLDRAGPSRDATAEHAENLPPAIEVQPFETLSPEADHRLHAEGFAVDIATAISKLDTLRVVSAGHGDGAGYHVKGSVRIAGSRIRCNVQLIEVADGHHLWSEKFDGQVDEIFEFQDHITNQVVAALEVELSEGQQVKRWRRESGDPSAYEDFLKARAAYKEYSRSGNARARTAYEAVLGRSPTFHSAAVGLARCHIEDATFGWSSDPDESLRQARSKLDGVLAMDPDHPSVHVERGHALMIEGDFPAARLEMELGVALDPDNADAHDALARVLVCLELPDEALRSARRAISLNPSAPEFYFITMADAFILLGRYREALAVAERIVAKRPTWIMARILNVMALHGLGKEAEAREVVRSLLEISPSFTAERWLRVIAYRDRADVPDLVERLVSAGLPP